MTLPSPIFDAFRLYALTNITTPLIPFYQHLSMYGSHIPSTQLEIRKHHKYKMMGYEINKWTALGMKLWHPKSKPNNQTTPPNQGTNQQWQTNQKAYVCALDYRSIPVCFVLFCFYSVYCVYQPLIPMSTIVPSSFFRFKNANGQWLKLDWTEWVCFVFILLCAHNAVSDALVYQPSDMRVCHRVKLEVHTPRAMR